MTPQDREMIADLFDRLSSVSYTTKDREANDFISDCIRRFPDAPYFLVQTTLVQQQALAEAEDRIARLQQASAAPAPSSRSFLSGVRSSSASGSRQTDPRDAGPASSPWSQAQPPVERQGGGFLSSALSTATGVAGGMFIADSIRNLFGGGSSWGGRTAADQAAIDQRAINSAQDDAQDAEMDADTARQELASQNQADDDLQDQQDYGNDSSDDGSYDV